MADRHEEFEKNESREPEKQAFSGLDLLMEGRQNQQGTERVENEFAARVKDPMSLDRAQHDFDTRFRVAMANESPDEMNKLFNENKQMLEAAASYIAGIAKALEKHSDLS